MIVDVLRRYLLIVWNFFFGQISPESIQDGPSADVVPPVEADSNEDEIANEDDDDVVEIFDDEEDEEEDDEDEDEVADVPTKAAERKAVTNDGPAEPSDDPVKKIEDAKAPKAKDGGAVIEKPESPKHVETREKPKTDSDIPETKETAKSTPGFEVVERDASKATPEGDASKLQPDFEIVERETGPKAVPEKDTSKSKPPQVETKGKEATREVVPDDVKPTEKVTAHVKFEDDDDEIRVPAKSPAATDTAGRAPSTTTASRDADGDANARFVVLEKGEAAAKNADGPREVDAFLWGEQKHGGRLQHPESIQDQQLDYSDSGEELSDDDIEIDYEDDEDEEEVEEVKPLPPVARSVYKKND